METLDALNWFLDVIIIGMGSLYFSRKLRENNRKRSGK